MEKCTLIGSHTRDLSAFLHFRKHKQFLSTWSFLGKIDSNFVSPKLILHNQSHDIVELMKSNSLLETDRRKSHSLSARQLRRLFFLTQFAESVFFFSPEACQTKELVAQWVKTLLKNVLIFIH